MKKSRVSAKRAVRVPAPVSGRPPAAPAAMPPSPGVPAAPAAVAPRRVFRLTYTTNPPREDPKLFKCRDGIAFSEVNSVLTEHGCAYQEAVILYPNDTRGLDEGYPRFRPSDLLVLATRPPLDDKAHEGPRKLILRNNGPLEKEILDTVCRKYFKYCSRRFVELTDRARDLLRADAPPGYWRYLEFFENHQTSQRQSAKGQGMARRHWAANVKKHILSPDRQVAPSSPFPSTVAYLVRDEIPSLGCDVVVSFGMDGDCTLIWNHLVRFQHPEWVLRRGFVMAELIFEKQQDENAKPPITISFADDLVRVRVLAEAGPLG